MFHGTWSVSSKFFMILVVFYTMFCTFERLRVIQEFSYIVTMIREVINDLKIFLLFFTIVILSFSNVLDIVGHSANEEYKSIGPLWGNLFATLRLSLGDFDFSQIVSNKFYLMHVMFWAVWVIMVIFSSLIFLNFIIAEVSNSYSNCREKIDQNI